MTRTVDFDVFDADNHYYEATDAFIRHLPPRNKKLVQWAEIGGKQRMIVDGKVFRFIPNPTFDPVARPGCLDEYFRGKRAGDNIRDAFGELEPINPAYREPEARVKLMDTQGIEGCFLFPTLGVGVEEALLYDTEKLHDVFHAFNEWMLDDWTFNYLDRIFAAPYIALQDPARAESEIEYALANGAHVVVMRAGPVRGPGFSRSPGDPVYNGVWARLAEAGVLVGYHSGDAGYNRYADEWGGGGDFQAFRNDPFRSVTSGHRPIYDTIAALACHGVLRRFPNLRVATIESGSDWMPGLLKALKKSYGQLPAAYEHVDPVEQVREHVWVSPYYEDDLIELRDALGVGQMLFGSDYPHAEGLADPKSFVDDLEGFTSDEVRLVMRENGLAFVPPARFVTRLILHITTAGEWDAAQRAGEHRPASLDDEGFVHCSLPTQVTHVADWFYRDIPDLVLLCIDPNLLTSPLRWEPSADTFAGDFPHVYGPIVVAAVVEAVPWERGDDGFALPDDIRHLLDG